jgi:hypothetical protein
MSKTRNATIANLTFVIGQLEEIKSNINDTMRYVKQNPEQWDTENEEEDSKNESNEDGNVTAV